MSITTFKAGIDANIVAKAGTPKAITPLIVGTAFKDAADLTAEASAASGSGNATSYTIAQLRAVTGTSTITGIVGVKDAKRQGFFYPDPSDTTSVDDNGVCIVTAGGQRMKRIFSGAVDLAWFGLVDNNVAESSSINQGTIISTVLKANKYGSYYIGKGTYWIDFKHTGLGGGIEMPSNINLVMHKECIIKARTPSIINPVGFLIAGKQNVHIEGGVVVGERYTNTFGGENGIAFHISASINVSIINCNIKDCHGDGIYIAGGKSEFVNPTAPVSQLMLGNVNGGGLIAGLWRCDVVGTGSVNLTVEGDSTPFATVTEYTSRHVQTPFTTGYKKIQADIVGQVESVWFDQPSYDILIDNVDVDNCRRNGITVQCALNFTISNSTLHNTNGTLPQAGIDLEPDFDIQRIWNGRLENIDSFDNVTQGFQVTGNNIVVKNCNAFRNGEEGFYLSNAKGAGGDYFVSNCKAYDNGSGLINMSGKKIVIDGLNIRNCNKDIALRIGGVADAAVSNILIEDCESSGILIDGAVLRSVLNNIIMINVSKSITQPALYCRTGNCQISNFKILGSGHTGIMTDSGKTGNSFTNGQVENCQQTGIISNSDSSDFVNLNIKNNNLANSTTGYNIQIKGINTKVALCTIKKLTGFARYGVQVDSTATGTILLMNDFAAGGSTGNIRNQGTGTVFTLPTT